jgi:hypothetical protein
LGLIEYGGKRKKGVERVRKVLLAGTTLLLLAVPASAA